MRPGAAPSPLAQELAAGMGVPTQTNDWGSAYGGFGLPRPASVFTDGAFSPFAPIQSVPLDVAGQGMASPDPRREEYRVGWNLPVGQPGTEGLKLADFNTLRTIADLYSVARACIQFLKAQITSLEWEIMPTQEAAKAMRGKAKAMSDFAQRRAAAVRFLRRPDPDYDDWQSWLADVLEEVLVYDALSIVVREKRGKGLGKGVLGSDLDCLQLVSGPTIRPLYDLEGGRPRPPAVAFQQYLYGVPRTDMWTMVTERDLDEAGLTGTEMRAYGGQQLMYRRTVPRRWTPYGMPPVERGLVPIMSGLQKQAYQLDYFREGTIPGIFVSPGGSGAEMTPNQIRELQDALNAIAGDPAWKHKVIVLPAGSKVDPMRPPAIADSFDEIVMMQTCMAFGVQPMQIGIMPQISTTTSPGAQNQMAKQMSNATDRATVAPTVIFLANLVDYVLQEVCGQADMRVMFEGMQEEEDEETTTNLLVNQVSHGLMTIDEARDVLGKQPFGLPETSDPGWATQTGYMPLNAAALQQTPDTGNVPQGALAQGAQPQAAGGKPSKVPPGPPAPPTAGGSGTATTPGPKRPPGGRDASGASPGHTAAAAGAAAAKKATPGKAPAKPSSTSTGNAAKKTAPAKQAPAKKAPAKAPVKKGAALFKSHAAHHMAARATAVNGLKQRVAPQLHALAMRHRDKQLSTAQATHEGQQILQDAYTEIYQQAADDATDQDLSTDDASQGIDWTGLAASRAATQGQYLMWMLAAAGVVGSALNWLAARIDLYCQSLMGAYNQGFGLAVQAANPTYTITWHLGEAEHCGLCIAREGKSYTFSSLPGWPGDGGFGGNDAICLGGQNCKCWLSYEEGGVVLATGGNSLDQAGYYQQQLADITQARMDAQQAREDFVAELPNDLGDDGTSPQSRAAAGDDLRTLLADLANQRIRSLGGYPGVSVEPQDIPASMIAQFLPQHGAQAAVADLAITDLMDAVGSVWPKFAGADITKANFEAALLGAYSDLRDRVFHVEPRKVYAEAEACFRKLSKGAAWQPKLLDDDSLDFLKRQVYGTASRAEAVSAFRAWFESRAVRARKSTLERTYLNSHDGRWVDTGGQLHDPTAEAEEAEAEHNPVVMNNPYDPAGYGGPVQRPHDVDDIFYAEPVPDGTRPLAQPYRREQGKGAADPTDPNPVEAEHVYNQLLGNYPPKAIKWVKGIRWIGPVQVPVDRVDTDAEAHWAATHQQARVDEFADKLRKGKPIKPGVSVQEPGESKIKVIDGHHRYQAAVKAGVPYLTYIGFVDSNGGPWDETHVYQFHQGASPENKDARVSKESVNYGPGTVTKHCGNCSMYRPARPDSMHGTCTLVQGGISATMVCDKWDPAHADKSHTGPVAAGIALHAKDTGRVLMLQRHVDDKDPAAGKWEFPGGCLEDDELPLDAAAREWREETGMNLPDGVEFMGSWESHDGVYHGYALCTEREADLDIHNDRGEVPNPDDPDGDHTEALAWWDPADIAGNPAVRDEVRAHAAELHAALHAGGDKAAQVVRLAHAMGYPTPADAYAAAQRVNKAGLMEPGYPQRVFSQLLSSLAQMIQLTTQQLRSGLIAGVQPGGSLPSSLGFTAGPNASGWPTL